MNYRFSITIGLSLLCLQTLLSQFSSSPALIVNHQNDTIYGVGVIGQNQKYCFFKAKDEKNYTKYYANDIDAFRIIDGKYFVSREIKERNGKTKWYFLEFLVDGEIDLYTIAYAHRFFLKKENADFLELFDNIEHEIKIEGTNYLRKDHKYIGYLKVYMSEAPEVFKKIEELDVLNQRDLVNISIDYHYSICNEYECVDYTKEIRKK